VAEWQRLIERLVRRYSLDRDLVRYWEIGNETDIGEGGGCPYLIPDAREYKEFYDMTASAIRRVAGHVKVGGPAACWVGNEPLPGFVERCRAEGTALDFVSWHIYSDDWERHREGVEIATKLVDRWDGQQPELLVTEWNRGFPALAVEEEAYSSRGCALVARAVIAMDEAGLGWSFYYHAMDQVCDPEVFAAFMSGAGVDGMYRHWNEVPHRFGLFGDQGEVRPQYFLFKLLSEMGGLRLRHRTEVEEVRVLAGLGEQGVSVMIVNVRPEPVDAVPHVVTVRLTGLSSGPRVLTLRRVDSERRWSETALELRPLERRRVNVRETFEFQVLVPEESVVVAKLGHPGAGEAGVTPAETGLRLEADVEV
jgi:xylan 1,4-beta-xylosidase